MYYNVSSTLCFNILYNTGHYVQSMTKSVSIQKLPSYLH